jgi:hypothetical protein
MQGDCFPWCYFRQPPLLLDVLALAPAIGTSVDTWLAGASDLNEFVDGGPMGKIAWNDDGVVPLLH